VLVIQRHDVHDGRYRDYSGQHHAQHHAKDAQHHAICFKVLPKGYHRKHVPELVGNGYVIPRRCQAGFVTLTVTYRQAARKAARQACINWQAHGMNVGRLLQLQQGGLMQASRQASRCRKDVGKLALSMGIDTITRQNEMYV
jgi:hypothetical protein